MKKILILLVALLLLLSCGKKPSYNDVTKGDMITLNNEIVKEDNVTHLKNKDILIRKDIFKKPKIVYTEKDYINIYKGEPYKYVQIYSDEDGISYFVIIGELKEEFTSSYQLAYGGKVMDGIASTNDGLVKIETIKENGIIEVSNPLPLEFTEYGFYSKDLDMYFQKEGTKLFTFSKDLDGKTYKKDNYVSFVVTDQDKKILPTMKLQRSDKKLEEFMFYNNRYEINNNILEGMLKN